MQAALHTLDIQERAVEQLRLRSGVLLAACSLIASIFGGTAIRANHGLVASGVVALAALAISTSLCVYLLLTKRGLTFTLDAEDVCKARRRSASTQARRHQASACPRARPAPASYTASPPPGNGRQQAQPNTTACEDC